MATRRAKPAMEPTTDHLVRIVTDLDKASEALPQSERQSYEDAQRSVVEARSSPEVHEDHVRIR
jgi:hypothetical protein